MLDRDLPLGTHRRRRVGGRIWGPVFFVLTLLLLLAWFRVGAVPEVEISPGLPAIGPATPVHVAVEEPTRGLGRLHIELVQGEAVYPLDSQDFEPRPFWAFWGPRSQRYQVDLEVGRVAQPELQEGEATLKVTAERAATWLRHPPPQIVEKTLAVHLRPPRLEVERGPASVATGGSGLVVYRVGAESALDGVRIGTWKFPGYPLPGGEDGERLAFFGVPFDLTESSEVLLVAADELGNKVEMPFLRQLKVNPFRQDEIRLNETFLRRVVPHIQAETPELHPSEDVLQDYLAINRDLRASNAQELQRLGQASARGLLWEGRFLQLPGSQVMSSFADRRTYTYQGRKVDQQDHLGFDLASTRKAPVPASNGGTVVLARFFGIYGRTVVIDHGYGLMSLYAHLSSIAVEEGQPISRGEVVGRTGATGLAGGDHLHFSILLHGLPVNPLEWWDPRWIERQILRRIPEVSTARRG